MGKGFEMIDEGNSNGRGVQGAKMCNMMTVNELHKRWVTGGKPRARSSLFPRR